MFSSFALIALSWAFNSPNGSAKSPFASPGWTNQAKTLAFADRVAYQRAVEEIYWRHRDWPATDGSAKPSLDQVMPQAQIEKKVEDYLRNSQALEDYWQKPITPEQLQAEMERMARQSKKPEVLREIFAALGNDPFVIAECLARPALAARLATNLYAHDQRVHGEPKRRAEADLAAHASVKQMKQISGAYTETEWIKTLDVFVPARQPPGVWVQDVIGVGKLPYSRGQFHYWLFALVNCGEDGLLPLGH